MRYMYGYTYATCKVHQIIIRSSSFPSSFRLFSAFPMFLMETLFSDHLSRGFFGWAQTLRFHRFAPNLSKIEKPTTKNLPSLENSLSSPLEDRSQKETATSLPSHPCVNQWSEDVYGSEWCSRLSFGLPWYRYQGVIVGLDPRKVLFFGPPKWLFANTRYDPGFSWFFLCRMTSLFSYTMTHILAYYKFASWHQVD